MARAPCCGCVHDVFKPALAVIAEELSCSLYYQALAGKLDGDPAFKGTVRFNGLTTDQALEQGIHTHRLSVYVDQTDQHMALLTVKVRAAPCHLLGALLRLILAGMPTGNLALRSGPGRAIQ